MGANKSMQSIQRIFQSTGGIKAIREQFDKTANIHSHSSKHSSRESKADEKLMINEIFRLNGFNYTSGRAHRSFPDIKRGPLKYLNPVEFDNWLQNHLNQISLNI